ncbi:MAG: esterase-like activity of phytase family protein [Phycisphaerae bacterium]|nr:esterase-like activity of phytase family protein [Phycisphaerae bacterium]
MIRRPVWMPVAVFMLASPLGKAESVVPLQLVRWLPVEGPANVQPSGLTIRGSSLLTISDKHDSTIFEITLGEKAAVLKPAVVLPSDAVSDGALDWEGITSDRQGNLYLVSETRFRVLRVDAAGKNAAWITPSLRQYGEAKGMFRVWNANLEGIAHVGGNRLVLCAERQPRGILELTLHGDGVVVDAYTLDTSRYRFAEGRSPDFADLFWDGSALYALERNAYLICRMTRGEKGYEEGPAWSYEHIVTREELRYSTMRFGRGEGLAMDDEHVYVILDNNGEARESRPEDRRPILLVMKRPEPRKAR